MLVKLNSPLLAPLVDPQRQVSIDEAYLEAHQNVFFQEGGLIGKAAYSLDGTPVRDSHGGLLSGALTVPQTIFNLANIIIGVGVLSVPYALKQSGLCAPLVMIVVIYVTGTAGKWIGDCLEMAAKCEESSEVLPSAWDFSFLAQLTLGSRAGAFINMVTVLEVWLALVTFLVMNGGNAYAIWPQLHRSFTVTVTGVLAAVGVFLPQRVFAYMSLVSTLAMVVAAAAMVASTFTLPHWAGPLHHPGVLEPVELANIPRAVGILIFCFAGHPCFPAVKTSMSSPRRWDYCIDISFLCAFMYYSFVGFLGYIVFGSTISPTVTENLEGIEGSRFTQKLAATCFLLKVQFTMPLLLNAVIVAVWPPTAGRPLWPPLRVALVGMLAAVTIMVAVSLSHAVAIIASLSGNLFVMTTSVLFPAVVHMKLSRRLGQVDRMSLRRHAEYCFVAVFGAVMAVTGTALAISDLLA